MTKKWFLLKVLYIFIVFWGSVICNEKTVVYKDLDNKGVDEIRKLILDLKKEGRSIILASHNREDIQILCDQVYEMDNGKIIG